MRRSYGTLQLTVTSPPQSFAEPLSVARLKGYLHIEQDDPTHDDDLELFIPAAREQAEIFQNRDLVQKQWDLYLDRFVPCDDLNYRHHRHHHHEIELRSPLNSVDLVQYRDSDGAYTALVEDTDYVADLVRGLIVPASGKTWPSFTPWPSSAVLVRFNSGISTSDPFWASSGARVMVGMKLLISAWFNNRLPFGRGESVAAEYPFTVTSCLSYGAISRVR
jgi:uncharacterized phiE125 gp8 family phage protein